jgi:hypothetical protein
MVAKKKQSLIINLIFIVVGVIGLSGIYYGYYDGDFSRRGNTYRKSEEPAGFYTNLIILTGISIFLIGSGIRTILSISFSKNDLNDSSTSEQSKGRK